MPSTNTDPLPTYLRGLAREYSRGLYLILFLLEYDMCSIVWYCTLAMFLFLVFFGIAICIIYE